MAARKSTNTTEDKMNKYIFTGNLTKDCRTATTPAGKAVCNFTVAVTDGYGDHEKTEFVDCAMFGKRAEGKLPGYLVKGQKVLVEGRPTLNKREHEGKFYANINVFVGEIELVGNKGGGERSEPQAETESAGGAADFSDDIPFSSLNPRLY